MHRRYSTLLWRAFCLQVFHVQTVKDMYIFFALKMSAVTSSEAMASFSEAMATVQEVISVPISIQLAYGKSDAKTLRDVKNGSNSSMKLVLQMETVSTLLLLSIVVQCGYE